MTLNEVKMEQFVDSGANIYLSLLPYDVDVLKGRLPAGCYNRYRSRIEVPNLQLLKQRLGTYVLLSKISGDEFQLTHLPSGKPILDNSNISISHTKDLISIITHPTKFVGIDLELRSRNVLRVIERVLSTNEKIFLKKQHSLNDVALLIWCAKEAFFKMCVNINFEDFSNIEVLPFEYNFTPSNYKFGDFGCYAEGLLNVRLGEKESTLKYRITSEIILCWGII